MSKSVTIQVDKRTELSLFSYKKYFVAPFLDNFTIGRSNREWFSPVVLLTGKQADLIHQAKKDNETIDLVNSDNIKIGSIFDYQFNLKSIHNSINDYVREMTLNAELDYEYNWFDVVLNHPFFRYCHEYEYVIKEFTINLDEDWLKETNNFYKTTYNGYDYRSLCKNSNAHSTIVAFQTRNPLHKSHEYLINTALETHDYVVISPLVGWTKDDDVPVDVRWKCYEKLIQDHFDSDRVILSGVPINMYYFGHIEAAYHARIRQSIGATHFIVGRNHASVGNFYTDPTKAQEYIKQLNKSGQLDIKPVCFDNIYYNKKSNSFCSDKTAVKNTTLSDKFFISGTEIRRRLKDNESLPEELIRPSIASILKDYYDTI